MTLLTKEAIEGKKVDIKKFYNLPEKVIHCSKCVVSNQRPRITFDENNVCSACRFSEAKNHKIDSRNFGNLFFCHNSAPRRLIATRAGGN